MIGPSIPSHLLIKQDDHENGDDDLGPEPEPSVSETGSAITKQQIGPSIPSLTNGEEEDEEDEDSWAPELPPDMAATSSSRPIVGPSFPSRPTRPEEDDDDDDFGPMPLPAGVSAHDEHGDAVREFMEREERRQKDLEESLKPKALKRDEWMLAPPKSSDLLGSLDPTKLKSRQFSRNTEEKVTVSSLWTETPAERQARLADEVMGKRKRSEISASGAGAEELTDEDRKRRKHDQDVSRTIEEYNKSKRGATLLDMHKPEDTTSTSSSSKDLLANSKAIWDHDRDLSLGGRLMDDGKRNNLINDAKQLGSRFSSGKSGRYL